MKQKLDMPNTNMTKELPVVKLDSIEVYNNLYGLETRHPLATVIDLKNASKVVNHLSIDYGMYAIFLKNGVNCTLWYGRQPYDYQAGTVVSFAPGQLVTVDMDEEVLAPDVLGLMFHPDLIYKTPLASKIKDYSFFDYSQREALHLSPEERGLFLESLEKIKVEAELPADRHTAAIISSHIMVLLEYLTRFYERQFATRRKANSELLRIFETELHKYFASGAVSEYPSVGYFADKVNLTPGYFGDMVKKETGKTPKELITLHIAEIAKQRLSATEEDISEIAYGLGFQYPQHFTRMFKRTTGESPTQFRARTRPTP
jgi:AraC-like DNA-binding protein